MEVVNLMLEETSVKMEEKTFTQTVSFHRSDEVEFLNISCGQAGEQSHMSGIFKFLN